MTLYTLAFLFSVGWGIYCGLTFEPVWRAVLVSVIGSSIVWTIVVVAR